MVHRHGLQIPRSLLQGIKERTWRSKVRVAAEEEGDELVHLEEAL